MSRDSFIFYTEWLDALKAIPDAEKAAAYEAVLIYGATGEVIDNLTPMAQLALNLIKGAIDRDREKYDNVKASRSEAGRKGMSQRWNDSKRTTNDNKNNSVISVIGDADNKNNSVISVIGDADNKNNGVISVIGDADNKNNGVISVMCDTDNKNNGVISVTDDGITNDNKNNYYVNVYDNVNDNVNVINPPNPPTRGEGAQARVRERVSDDDATNEGEATMQRNDATNETTPAPSAPPQRKTFTPPTLDDLQLFMQQYADKHHTPRGAEQAQRFIDYYTSNGWMVGRNHMKDWKAAARNWLARQDAQRPTTPAPPSQPTCSPRDIGTFNEHTPTPHLGDNDDGDRPQRQTPEEREAIIRQVAARAQQHLQQARQIREEDNRRAAERLQQQRQQKKTMNILEYKALKAQQIADGTYQPSDFRLPQHQPLTPGTTPGTRNTIFANVPPATMSDQQFAKVQQQELQAYLQHKAQEEEQQDNNPNNSQL